MPLPYASAQFITSLAKPGTLPETAGPEVAFAGRSNAGKSTTLNKICRRKNLARTSKTPGRTQLINYFEMSNGARLIDLPGYGYAKAPISQKKQWGKLIEYYIQNSPTLNGLVIVMDSRHPMKEGDIQMIQWCEHCNLPMILLLNKIDKLKNSAAARSLQSVKKSVAELSISSTVIPFSASKGTGLDRLHDELDAMFSLRKENIG